MFTLNCKNIFSAVAYAVISAVLLYLSGLADITTLNFHMIGVVAITAAVSSLAKNFLTTDQGTLAGVPVAEPKPDSGEN